MDDRLPPVGRVLRNTRARAGVSQLELSSRTGISTRHLSYVETGRAEPSRELLERLADGLGLRGTGRDDLLRSGGYSVAARSSRGTAPPIDALQELVDGMHPVPAIIMDETWTLIVANSSAALFLERVAAHLRTPPINLLRLVLHPEGLIQDLANAREVRADLLTRLARQRTQTADPRLDRLAAELGPAPMLRGVHDEPESPGVPMRLRTDAGVVCVTATPGVLGVPNAPAHAHLSLELFPPSDAVSRERIARLLG